jgi:serine/threonine protein phosphatase PrpC
MLSFNTAKRVEGYRTVLEDRAEVIETGGVLLLVVADGAGGISGGERAAESAVSRVREGWRSMPDPHGSYFWGLLPAALDEGIEADAQAGETTLVVAAVSPKGLVGASVGDSGAWMVRGGSYTDLTERQHRKPLLGSGGAAPVPFSAPRLEGTLLLASDGLLKYASPERICEAASGTDLEAAAERLVEMVRLRSGALQDDVSVILCREG